MSYTIEIENQPVKRNELRDAYLTKVDFLISKMEIKNRRNPQPQRVAWYQMPGGLITVRGRA